jgi:hypothetical protein
MGQRNKVRHRTENFVVFGNTDKMANASWKAYLSRGKKTLKK